MPPRPIPGSPGDWMNRARAVSEGEYRQAIRSAETILAWVEAQMVAGG